MADHGKMVSMKMTKKKSKVDKTMEVSSYDDGRMYPYGLSITLNNEVLKKLKMGVEYFPINKKCKMYALLEVTNVSDPPERKDDQSVGLQIVALEIHPVKGGKKKMSASKVADYFSPER